MQVRKRLSPEDARANILRRAEHYLIAGGPHAVRVQVIAHDLGITDAAIHYHFKNREGLMVALLREAGRKLQAEVAVIAGKVTQGTDALAELAAELSLLYRDKKYARLAIWLHEEGVHQFGSGMFDPLVDRIHETLGGRKTREDVQYAVALLNTFLVGDDLVGSSFLASVSLPSTPDTEAAFRAWVVGQISASLGL